MTLGVTFQKSSLVVTLATKTMTTKMWINMESPRDIEICVVEIWYIQKYLALVETWEQAGSDNFRENLQSPFLTLLQVRGTIQVWAKS